MSSKRVVLADLGWCIARLSIDDEGIAETLIIAAPADCNPERYAPAESICIDGRGNINTLFEFLQANLQANEFLKQPRQGMPLEEQKPSTADGPVAS